jgi:hypothetical protein
MRTHELRRDRSWRKAQRAFRRSRFKRTARVHKVVRAMADRA